ncbi:MAG: hypothetical protein ACI88C_000070 [Acidimicrobiales bacterium]|jgi:hypothetical protein
MKFDLKNVRRGGSPGADQIVMIGLDKVGKTSFAADAPKPIFCMTEDGLQSTDVEFLPNPDDAKAPCLTSWPQVLGWMDEIAKGESGYETLVFDTLTETEKLLHQHLCRLNGWKSMDTLDYGACYKAAINPWREFLMKLDAIHALGIELILLVHAEVKPFKNPDGGDYKRFEMAINNKAADMFRRWAHTILFARQEEQVSTEGKRVVLEDRVMYSVRSNGFDAGTRHDVPAKMPLDYKAYADARDIAHNLPSLPELAEMAMSIIGQLSAHPAHDMMLADAQELIANEKPRLLYQRIERLRVLVEELQTATEGTEES